MTGSLIALEWAVIGGCILAAAVIVAALLCEAWTELRRQPAPGWRPGGPTYPRTPRAAELDWTLALGMSPEAVEAEIRELAHGRERPA